MSGDQLIGNDKDTHKNESKSTSLYHEQPSINLQIPRGCSTNMNTSKPEYAT